MAAVSSNSSTAPALATTQPLQLTATTVTASTDSRFPTLVLIHGLDSTRFTWNPFIQRCNNKYNIIALDIRAHGESPLGNTQEDFTAQNLALDIKQTLTTLKCTFPFVLVGHSMGGRVAIQYCADYPEDLSSLIIEDMDVKPRTVIPLSAEDAQKRHAFTRDFATFEEAKGTLMNWYDSKRIDGWKKDGRVFERQGSSSTTPWHSGINPMAQHLALQYVLGEQGVGLKEWRKCGSSNSASNQQIYCFVAGKGSACSPESLLEMRQAVPDVTVIDFSNAFHSIHNTSHEHQFDVAIEQIMLANEKEEFI